jgi:hypothetical protein
MIPKEPAEGITVEKWKVTEERNGETVTTYKYWESGENKETGKTVLRIITITQIGDKKYTDDYENFRNKETGDYLQEASANKGIITKL